MAFLQSASMSGRYVTRFTENKLRTSTHLPKSAESEQHKKIPGHKTHINSV